MIKSLISKIAKKPTIFYAMSIAATWANAGSLLNGISTAQNDGIVPFFHLPKFESEKSKSFDNLY